ncbi:MAG: hypothetical protein ACTSX1_15165 [Candidatus Heimdallarchaeaceae archaeon]
MEILKVHEPEGDEKCCRMECSFSEEEMEILLSYAVTNILKEQIKKMDEECSGERLCFDCQGEIDDETIRRFPDTELCIDCIDDVFI